MRRLVGVSIWTQRAPGSSSGLLWHLLATCSFSAAVVCVSVWLWSTRIWTSHDLGSPTIFQWIPSAAVHCVGWIQTVFRRLSSPWTSECRHFLSANWLSPSASTGRIQPGKVVVHGRRWGGAVERWSGGAVERCCSTQSSDCFLSPSASFSCSPRPRCLFSGVANVL